MSLANLSIAGFPGVEEQRSDREYIPGTGWRTVRRWKGLDADVVAFTPQLVALNLQFRIHGEGGPLSTVEAWFPDAQDGAPTPADVNDQQTVTWELSGNDLEKDIFTHSAFLALSEANQEALQQYRNGEIDLSAAPSTGDAGAFANLITAKVESYTISQYVLRRTALVPLSWTGTVAMTNVGSVYADTATLTTDENVPVTIKWSMPSGMWLKRTPTILQQRFQWQITNEWWHADEWAEVLYTRV